MGKKFDELIEGLTDHELAIYVGYQYDSFLPNARERVHHEIQQRGLTKNVLDDYALKKLSNVHGACERCGSTRFFQDHDIEHSGSEYKSSELEVITNRCRLCNHNPSKSYEKNIFKRIKRYFFDPNKTVNVRASYYWLDDKPHYPRN